LNYLHIKCKTTGIIGQYLPLFKQFTRRKLREVHGGIFHRYNNAFASIDCKRFAICRPSGPNNQQAVVYNDYYGYHNIGFQGVTGIQMECFYSFQDLLQEPE
jgi:hypothetical protein